jgi:murein DD-endopeptidase MepM/ murein hydrolase activator NlpD
MGYGNGNPTGSRERTQQLDPSSPNYVPGLAAGQSTYAVIGEGPQREALKPSPNTYPFVPTYETRRLDDAVTLGEYLDKRDEIYARYKAEETDKIKANPQWTGEKVAGDRSDFYGDFYDRRQAELDALDTAYPTVAGKYKEPNAASLRGANPLETTEAALNRLIAKARDDNEPLHPGDYPEGADRETIYAWNQKNDKYEAAVSATLQELMGDPQNASDIVFGRPLNADGAILEQPAPRVGPADRSYNRDTGKATIQSETTGQISVDGQPGGPTVPGSTVAAGAGTGQAGVGQQQANQATAGVGTGLGVNMTVPVDPKNEWGPQMAAAEQEYGLPVGLLQAVARHESNFDPEASSGAANGLMQFTPDTWDGLPDSLGLDDVWDPEQSITAAAYYLNQINQGLPADKKDNVAWMVAAYNIGPGAVAGMTDLKDIISYSEDKGYKDAQARYQYALDIAAEVSGSGSDMTVSAGTQQFVRPVEGGSEKVSQEYGANVEGYKDWNGPHGHEGIDYSVPVGTAVKASAGGTVVFVGTGNGFDNYGKYVVIDHGDGYKSYYAHLSGYDVAEGDTVAQGQIIAKSGNTGRSTGAHLHFALQKEGDTSGPYGMVDPTDFILGRAGIVSNPTFASDTHSTSGEGVSVAHETPKAIPPSSSAGAGAPASVAKTGTGINWGVGITDAESALTQAENKNKSEEKIALDSSIDAAWAHSKARIAKEYPQHDSLFEQYQGVNDEDRQDWKNANPMIRALNLLVYSEKEWEQVEKQFGKGAVEGWALIPRGENASEQAGAYYRKNPTTFLTKAWIQGRPEPFDADKQFDPAAATPYDFGSDYATAKGMFGNDIWDIVRTYYASVPKYVQGGDNTAWIAFKDQYPQFDQWQDWWYALMNAGQPVKAPFQRGSGGFSGGFNGFDPSQGEHPQYIQNVEARRGDPPKWTAPNSSSGDWRRYLEVSKLGIRNPNR